MLIISDEKFSIKIKLTDENGTDVTADILSPDMGIEAAVDRAIAWRKFSGEFEIDYEHSWLWRLYDRKIAIRPVGIALYFPDVGYGDYDEACPSDMSEYESLADAWDDPDDDDSFLDHLHEATSYEILQFGIYIDSLGLDYIFAEYDIYHDGDLDPLSGASLVGSLDRDGDDGWTYMDGDDE